MGRRVCHVSSVRSPFDVCMFYRESKTLLRAGFAVTIVAPHDGNEVVEDVRIVAVPKADSRLARMTRTVWRVYQKALEENAAVYHLHDPELIPIGLLLRLRGRNVVMDVHEDYPRLLLNAEYLPLWSRKMVGWLLERLEIFAGRHWNAILGAWPRIETRFRAINDRTVTVHYYLPSVQEIEREELRPLRERPNWILYVGSIEMVRGMRQMLDAMALLPDGLGTVMKLAGTFDSPGLRREMERSPGWRKVDFLGWLPRSDVLQLLAKGRIGLVTLHPTPQHRYAWPTKLFEYMLAGTPVIASDIPLYRETVEGAGCGLVVDPMDPKAIAQATEYLLTHPEEAQTMGENGRRAVETRYNWELEEDRFLEVHQEILAGA